MEEQYDVIVVGTGPAGATIAAQMARAGQRVLMLEKGAYHPSWLLGNQLTALLHFDKLGLLATKENMMVARCITVGGSAVMSCGSATPPYPGMFEGVGVDLTEEVKEAHAYMKIDDDFPEHLIGKGQMRLMEVANSLGHNFRKLPKFIDRNKCRGGACMKGCPTGAKWSGRVPVEEARSHGARLVTRAEVVRAITEGGEATGVVTKNGDKYFGKTVVLCAGGLASPLILRNSGVKEAGDKFGFDALWFTYGFSKENPTAFDIDMGIYDDTYLRSDGFVLSPVMHTWGMYLASATVGGGWSYLPKFAKFGKAVSVMTKVKDDLGGAIYDDGSFSKPLTERDWKKLKKGEEIATRILKQAGCEDIFSCKPFAAHPCASVRIGDHIDTNFESKIKNLFVCDTSSFPESMGLPCVWTCTTLGLKMSKILKQRLEVAQVKAAPLPRAR
ncbi:MAG: GMC family oxidoreductase N-terminal domain-containing protein [bacterium]